MNFSGLREAFASPLIGSVDVLEAKMPFGGEHRLGFLRDLRLQVALLEHRLDDEVAAGEVLHVLGRLDQRQCLFGFRLRCAALLHAPLEELRAVALAGLAPSRRNVLQHARHAARGIRPGDARAHHARAEDADFRAPSSAATSAGRGPSRSRRT